MSAPKWTPGQWRATTRQGSWDWVVYTKDDPNIEICQMFHDGTDENEIGEANAHLVAAAPELYEALDRAREKLQTFASEHPDPGPDTWAVLDEIRAVLAKARGAQ